MTMLRAFFAPLVVYVTGINNLAQLRQRDRATCVTCISYHKTTERNSNPTVMFIPRGVATGLYRYIYPKNQST